MLFNLAAQHGTGYLIIIGSGTASLSDLCGAGSFAAETARREGYRGVLFDMLSTEARINGAQRRELGMHFTKQFERVAPLAVVVHPQECTGVGAQVAKRRGMNMAVFSQIEAASAWLESELRALRHQGEQQAGAVTQISVAA